MTVSVLWTGLNGSKSTRLLKHGMAGHMVEIVGLSWMAKPCGKSSRSLKVREPPRFGVCVCPYEGVAVRITSAARTTAAIDRVTIMVSPLVAAERVQCGADARVAERRRRPVGDAGGDAHRPLGRIRSVDLHRLHLQDEPRERSRGERRAGGATLHVHGPLGLHHDERGRLARR